MTQFIVYLSVETLQYFLETIHVCMIRALRPVFPGTQQLEAQSSTSELGPRPWRLYIHSYLTISIILTCNLYIIVHIKILIVYIYNNFYFHIFIKAGA